MTDYVLWFDQVSMGDVERVGGKNASLGEMISNLSEAGVSVPGGFATTADAYREFLAFEGLDQRIQKALDALDVNDIRSLSDTGAQIRSWKKTYVKPSANCRKVMPTSQLPYVHRQPQKTCRMPRSPVSRKLT